LVYLIHEASGFHRACSGPCWGTWMLGSGDTWAHATRAGSMVVQRRCRCDSGEATVVARVMQKTKRKGGFVKRSRRTSLLLLQHAQRCEMHLLARPPLISDEIECMGKNMRMEQTHTHKRTYPQCEEIFPLSIMCTTQANTHTNAHTQHTYIHTQTRTHTQTTHTHTQKNTHCMHTQTHTHTHTHTHSHTHKPAHMHTHAHTQIEQRNCHITHVFDIRHRHKSFHFLDMRSVA